MMIKTFTLVLALFIGLATYAQFYTITFQEVADHSGVYSDGVDLTGYKTFDMYVHALNEEAGILSIYSIDDGTPGVPDASDTFFDFQGAVFQHENAGLTQGQNDCNSWPANPTMEFDTFWTAEDNSSCEADLLIPIFDWNIPDAATGEAAFEGPTNGNYFDGGNFWMDDGEIIYDCLHEKAQAGSDLKVKIARITTNASFTGYLSIKCCGSIIDCDEFDCEFDVLCNDTIVNGMDTTFVLCSGIPFSCNFDCDPLAIDNSVEILEDILCFGDLGTLQVGQTPGVTYSVVDGSSGQVIVQDGTDPTISGLGEGSYSVLFEDGSGCTAFGGAVLFEPDPLDAWLEYTIYPTCWDMFNGEICIGAEGGTGSLSYYTFDGWAMNGSCAFGLGCGDTGVEVVDENGCSQAVGATLFCPDPVYVTLDVAEPNCSEECNGQISLQVEGGMEPYTIEVYYDGAILGTWYADFWGQTVDIQGLCGGGYDLFIYDSFACPIFEYAYLEPVVALDVDYEVENVSCFGECDGSVTYDVSGGQEPYIIECWNEQGIPIGFEDLCEGSYTLYVLDAAGCEVFQDIAVGSSSPLEVLWSTYDVSCNALCDGWVSIDEIISGSGMFEVEFNSELAYYDGNGTVLFSDVCAGVYDMLVTDISTGCQVTVFDIIIVEPGPIDLSLDPNNALCFGDATGTIEITCDGGFGVITIVDINVPCPYLDSDLMAGQYVYQVMDENGCTAIDSASVGEPDLLDVLIFNIQDTECFGMCTGSFDADIFGGTGPYGAVLDGIDVGTSASDLCQGVYSFCAIDDHGCMTCVDVEIYGPTEIQMQANTTGVTCTGMGDGAVQVLAVGGVGDMYLEYDPEIPQLDALYEGEYTAMASDENGCFNVINFTIGAINDNPFEIHLETTTESCWETHDATAAAIVVGGEAPFDYLWDDENEQTSSIAIGLRAFVDYQVKITDNTGCEQFADVTIDPNLGCLQITTGITPNGDGANDYWVIGGIEEFPNAHVQVYSRWGQLLFNSNGYSNPWDGTYEGKPVGAADYYYIIDYLPNVEPLTGVLTVKR